jgi:hypothetical protein
MPKSRSSAPDMAPQTWRRRCCVSKGREPPERAERDEADAGVRAELAALKLSTLRRRAAAAGVEPDALDAIDDAGGDIKGAIIELLLDLEGAHEPRGSGGGAAALRRELGDWKLSALRRRALELKVDQDQLDAADDAEDIKQSLIELILRHETPAAGAAAPENRDASLRRELDQMPLSALRRRALELKVDQDQLDAADDADDIKQSLIELIVMKSREKVQAPGDTPHFGAAESASTEPEEAAHAAKAVEAAAEARPAHPRSTKHVMLSYQWDHQQQVKRAYDLLTKLGVKCWMDIAGGMSGDIYESMANAVANASVVVLFMSQQYQESENCMLEVKFAKQSGVEIIPVMMAGGGWRPSGWLGLITAGALWTRLSSESEFEASVRQLHGQIQQALGAAVLEELEVTAESAASPSEAKEELERLRDDLAPLSDAASAPALADPSEPATIPAGVPKLPAKFQTTEQIQQLTRLVLSTSASDMRRTVF